MVKAQFGKAQYSDTAAFCIATEVDSTGAYAVVEIVKDKDYEQDHDSSSKGKK